MYIKLEEGLYLIGSGLFGLSNWKDCSVYLLTSGNSSVIVDSGSGLDTDRLLNNLLETGISKESVKYILLTHAHGDHAGGISEMKKQFPQAKIVTSAGEAHLLEAGTEEELGLDLAKACGAYPKDYLYHHASADYIVRDGEHFPLSDSCWIEAHIASGHTEESVLYLICKNGKRYLFCGDYIFLRGIIGLLNSPGSSLAGYRNSLPEIAKLQIDALLPGHREFALNNAQRFLKMAADGLRSTRLPQVM